jgi:hypothetical protein
LFNTFISVGLIAIFIIWIQDLKSGGYINMTPKDRKIFDASKNTQTKKTEQETNFNDECSKFSDNIE